MKWSELHVFAEENGFKEPDTWKSFLGPPEDRWGAEMKTPLFDETETVIFRVSGCASEGAAKRALCRTVERVLGGDR